MDLAICTIEKANSLMNKIIEEKVYFDISFFIIDEFHLVILLRCFIFYRFLMNSVVTNWRA